jgi:hypothetical protein
MEIVPDTGEVRGTPNTEGTFNFVVQVRDANLQIATASMSAFIRARAAGAFAILATALPPAQVNTTYTHTFTSVGACTVGTPNPFSGNVGRVTWTVPQGSVLPQGLTLTDSGVLAGNPREVGSHSFAVRAPIAAKTRRAGTVHLWSFATTVSQRSMTVRPGAGEFPVQYTAAEQLTRGRDAGAQRRTGRAVDLPSHDYHAMASGGGERDRTDAANGTILADGISTFLPANTAVVYGDVRGLEQSDYRPCLYVSGSQNVSVSATSFLST